ncbi:uncharacterized protein [Aegilops tauschii subsp. strangulata]|uniref:F-box domain-containing protein n=2 Tax=Triticinae TaxID=1648030 RepID=A0A3B6MM45_WHEAT|nr:uncharacterized protein LOC109750276 [Aegilops tauschii subsp. strangulata]
MDDLSGRTAASPPPPPLTLPLPHDNLLLEILLRLPPEPIYLLRASLVSKHWRRLVHDARFLRRFRAFHGAPPVLGFLNNQPGPPLFVPTSDAFAAVPSSMMSHDSWWALDCRHGRALLQHRNSGNLLVWHLMSGEQRCLPRPPPALDGYDCGPGFNAAVLRAAGNEDRLDCRSCPFLVAVALTHGGHADLTSACVYSSKTGVWGDVISVATLEEVEARPTTLVGNTLYWPMTAGCILEFDVDKYSLDTSEVPNDMFCYYEGLIVLMPAEHGGLGFAAVDGLSLHLFSRVATTDGTLVWTLCRAIDLNKFLTPDVVVSCKTFSMEAIGVAEGADVVFIYACKCAYMLHLKSMQFDEVSVKGTYASIFPYTSFYTPVLPCLLSSRNDKV